MFYIIIILAGIFAMPVQAQSLRDQLVGAWSLVSCANGPWCANPNGIHILDASGHYATINAPLDRPVVIISDPKGLTDIRNRTTPEQYKAIATTFLANFGTWQVDETDKTIAYHYDGSLYPNPQEEKVPVSVSGDELKLGSTASFTGTSVWRRIKK
jgi:hypothetical protein